jgi:hypothetical protein
LTETEFYGDGVEETELEETELEETEGTEGTENYQPQRNGGTEPATF